MASTASPTSSPQGPSKQQQQQQIQKDDYDYKEEYISAQRSAYEAVQVGRETLHQVVQQGEQLNRAEALSEETEYKLDKAARILRGMTWSGWVANMLTKTIGPPPPQVQDKDSGVPTVYEDVPPQCRETAQAIQNYHANLNVLESCETQHDKETLNMVCDAMYERANKSLHLLKKEYPKQYQYSLQFETHLETLRNRQKHAQIIAKQADSSIDAKSGNPERMELFDNARPTSEPLIHPHQREQDEHLAIVSQSLGELGAIAQNLHQSIQQQSQTIHSLDTQTDRITEKSRMVTRRADRMVQKSSWRPTRPVFFGHVAIQHIATGKYLAALDENDLYLVNRFQSDACVFGLWKRQGHIFGLQNRRNNRWAGQNLFGYVACSASSFGRREEWEAGDDWARTPLLCASAGWGAGGYVVVNPKNSQLSFVGCSVEDRNHADVWAFLEQTNLPPPPRI